MWVCAGVPPVRVSPWPVGGTNEVQWVVSGGKDIDSRGDSHAQA